MPEKKQRRRVPPAGETASPSEARTQTKKRAPPAATKVSPRKLPRPKKTVAILSRKRSLYSTRRLVEAITRHGHRPLVVDTLRCTMVLAKDAPRMLYRGVDLAGLDVAIPRIGASITAYGLAVVNQLDMMGVPVLNNSLPIARSRDKLRCLQLVSRFGIDIPRTVMAHERSNVSKLVQEVGGLPVIIKLIRGTQGVGVMIAHTLQEAHTILNTFGELGQETVLQEFIAESNGRDIRALVVGDRVVGAMRRQAKQGEFRSNLHRGGEGTPIELPEAWAQAAVKAAHIVGLELAGVDMLETESGPKLMEINSSPGFEGLESATRKDIAGEIIAHALAFAEAQRAGWSKRRVI